MDVELYCALSIEMRQKLLSFLVVVDRERYVVVLAISN